MQDGQHIDGSLIKRKFKGFIPCNDLLEQIIAQILDQQKAVFDVAVQDFGRAEADATQVVCNSKKGAHILALVGGGVHQDNRRTTGRGQPFIPAVRGIACHSKAVCITPA